MTQKTELGEAQKALQHQLNEVKGLISEFEDKRAAFGVGLVFAPVTYISISITSFFGRIQVQAETAAEARLKAQNEKQHYEKKYAAEFKQVEAVEAAAKVLQEEFTVCCVCSGDWSVINVNKIK